MSGTTVSRALYDRFEQIRRSELARLERKLRRLSDVERQSVEAVVTDVIAALARPATRLAADAAHPRTLEAIVHLFELDLPG